QPLQGDTHQVMNFASFSGDFATLGGLDLGQGLFWRPEFDPAAMRLVAFSVPQNRPPVAGDDEATTAEDTPRNIAVLANDSDPDGGPLTVQAVDTGGTSGTVAINVGGATLTYTPRDNFAGIDRFRYTVSDGRGGTDVAQVTVQVESAATADLVVTSFTAPTEHLIGNPAQAAVTWTV